jgi:hypothetical protein
LGLILIKKSKILRKFLATASLCGTLFTSSNAAGATVLTTGLVDVNLNTNAGLATLFNNNDTIQIVTGLPGIKMSANKANAQIGGITTLVGLLNFGGVEVSQNVSIGPLSATIGLTPDFGPLKFISNGTTATITGVGNQTFSGIDFAGKNSTLQINNGLNITTKIDNTVAGNNGIITFVGTGTISNNIGLTNSLSGINVGNGEVQIYMPGAGNSIINAANINLTNNNSILTLFDGNATTLTGNINNTTGNSGQGILNLAHDLASDNGSVARWGGMGYNVTKIR